MISSRLLLATALAVAVAGVCHGQDTDSIEHGRAAFERHCAACHGRGTGDEDEPASFLPGTFALQLKYRGEVPALLERRTDLSVEVLRVFLRNGVGSMPPFRPTTVTDEDIEAIAAFLAHGTN